MVIIFFCTSGMYVKLSCDILTYRYISILHVIMKIFVRVHVYVTI